MQLTPETTRNQAPMTMILATGSPDTAQQILATLEEAAPGWFEVTRAASFAEVYSLLNETPRDLLFLDWHLRGMSLASITGLRSSEPQLATVVFTAPQDTSIAHKIVRAGVQECICMSSIDGHNLRNLLRHAVQRQQSATASEATLKFRCDQLVQLLPIDEATGLHNAESFTEQLEKEIMRSQRYNHPFALVVLEIDEFAAIEDTYGKRSFLTILRLLADVLRGGVRKIDEVGRIGKGRFGILCVESVPEGVSLAMQRIMIALKTNPLNLGAALSVSLSVSCGILPWSPSISSAPDMIAQAAALLDKAKNKGPGRVEVQPPADGTRTR